MTDRALLQRLLTLLAQSRRCELCAAPTDSGSCHQHDRDWKRLERDVKKKLGEAVN